MALYKIRDAEQEEKLKNKQEVIAGTIKVDEDKVSLIDGWKSIQEVLAYPEISALTGGESEGGRVEEEVKLKPGDKGYFKALTDLLMTLGFYVEKIPEKE